MNSKPRKVAASMPPITPVPMAWRAFAPAPEEIASGVTPMMNASEVIRIGRRRSLAASTTACASGLPALRSWIANSTIRIAFFAARPITVIRPILK